LRYSLKKLEKDPAIELPSEDNTHTQRDCYFGAKSKRNAYTPASSNTARTSHPTASS
jgi:hypothetical protein